MFRADDLVLVNKMDLLAHLDVDLELLGRNIAAVNPSADVVKVSARAQEGLADWLAWLDEHVTRWAT